MVIDDTPELLIFLKINIPFVWQLSINNELTKIQNVPHYVTQPALLIYKATKQIKKMQTSNKQKNR